MKLETNSKFEYIFIIIMIISIVVSFINYCKTTQFEISFFIVTIMLVQYFYRHLKFEELNFHEESSLRVKVQSQTSMAMSMIVCLIMAVSYFLQNTIELETWILIALILLVFEVILLFLYIINGLRAK